MNLGLSGRVCVITGASGGIGSATARALAAEGADLVLVGRRRDALGELAAACTALGSASASVLAVDLLDPAAGEEIVAAATSTSASASASDSGSGSGPGRLDVLVNGAGTAGTRPLDELPDQAWQEQWELHVMAPMRLMRAAAPRMAERGWGRIVNLTSSAARRPSGGLDMSYSVTKAAQLALSRAFADLYADQGVLVNAVAPGAIDGDMWRVEGGLAEQRAQRSGQSVDEVMAGMAARTTRGKLGSEDEVAAVIAFLCSEQAANVTGAAWAVDGGTVPTIF